jgi:hypothetical protein
MSTQKLNPSPVAPTPLPLRVLPAMTRIAAPQLPTAGFVAPGEATPTVAPHLDEPNLNLTFEYMRFLNQHTTDYIRMADAKAAILVTLLSANLLVLVQRAADAIARLHNPGTIFLIVAAIMYCLVSLGVATNVIRPRLFRNHTQGHIFWEDIAAQDKATYAGSFPSLTGGEIVRELGEHNHNMACSANRKFRWLRTGFYLALSSIAFSATIILFTTEPITP